jgi:hypothetical protein
MPTMLAQLGLDELAEVDSFGHRLHSRRVRGTRAAIRTHVSPLKFCFDRRPRQSPRLYVRGANMAKKLGDQAMQPEPQSVSIRAYELWEQEGRPDGRDQAHWFEAERQLQKLQRGSLVEKPLASLATNPAPQSSRRRRRP